ncbi:MAG: thioredoxin domain-containing protein [bacterium]
MRIKLTGKIIFASFILLLLIVLVWILNTDQKTILEDNQAIIEDAGASNFLPVRSINKSDWVWGNEDALIELIVYNDLSCLFCSRFNQVVEQIKTEFPEQVKIAYRHFPLDIQSESLNLAMAVECAGEQHKFMEMYQGIMESEDKINIVSELITTLGLDQDKFNKCLTKEKYRDKIVDQMKEAKSFGALGAPSSFLNGQSLPGAYQFEDFVDQNGREYLGMKNLILKKLSGQ